jgi:hypothetical protein
MCGRERRPMAAAAVRECCELGEHGSPHFRWAAEAVSAKESDRLVAIAHPDAAVGAAVASMSCGVAGSVKATAPTSPKVVLPICSS